MENNCLKSAKIMGKYIMNLANIEHKDRLLSTNLIVSDSQMRSKCDSLALSTWLYRIMLPQRLPIQSSLRHYYTRYNENYSLYYQFLT